MANVTRSGVRRPIRRFWLIAGLVGLFIILDIGLFGWLIFRSLSQRELDRTLLETRAEAQALAGRLNQSAEQTGGDLFTAFALEQETQTYIDSVLRQRRIDGADLGVIDARIGWRVRVRIAAARGDASVREIAVDVAGEQRFAEE